MNCTELLSRLTRSSLHWLTNVGIKMPGQLKRSLHVVHLTNVKYAQTRLVLVSYVLVGLWAKVDWMDTVAPMRRKAPPKTKGRFSCLIIYTLHLSGSPTNQIVNRLKWTTCTRGQRVAGSQCLKQVFFGPVQALTTIKLTGLQRTNKIYSWNENSGSFNVRNIIVILGILGKQLKQIEPWMKEIEMV